MVTEQSRFKFSNLLLAWYQKNARDLPWRRTSDPYLIWVSEIMLQQTRVKSVIPYFNRWVKRFPTLEILAEADQDEVLSLWEGLGYYRRAVNLHQAVKEIQTRFKGKIPEDPGDLKQLPGIGPYTAGAIASIAFNKPASILDGNIRRVISRCFNVQEPLGTGGSEKILQTITRELIPENDPGDFNQALMELGAMICLPVKPHCQGCPLREDCAARQLGIQGQLPNRKQIIPLPHYQVTAAIMLEGDQVLIAKRPLKALLGGMWEYPGGKQEKGESLEDALKREICEELGLGIEVGELLGVYDHAYTHYKVTLFAYFCQRLSKVLNLNYHTDHIWVEPDALDNYPMGKIDRLISIQLQEMT